MHGLTHEKLEFMISYGVLAPSVHNSQPWLFRIVDDAIEVRVDRRRAMPVADPHDRELIMSCGSALMNLRLAARRFGFKADVHVFPNPDEPTLVARLEATPSRDVGPRELAMFQAIVRRRTNRRAFLETPLDDALTNDLIETATSEGVSLSPMTGGARRTLISIIEDADRQQFHDRRYRHELASWLVPNRSRRREGIPGYSLGINTLASLALPAAVRTLDLGRLRAARDRRLARKAAVLAVLCTKGDGPVHWLAAGQALEAVALTAQAHGWSSAFLGQALEVPTHRQRIRSLVGSELGYPQQVIAIGRAEGLTPTPRRRLDDVVENGMRKHDN